MMTTHRPDPAEFLPLHPLEFRILLVLSDGPAHGYRIVKEIEAAEDGDGRIYPANLYRRIRNLSGECLIEECPAPEDVPAEDARKRTYYRPTGLGRRVARAEALRLEELVIDARRRRIIEGRSG